MRLKVDAISEIVNIFKKSENGSCMKGRSHFLMRRAAPFRARKYQDIEMDDREEVKSQLKGYSKRIKELEDTVAEYDERQDMLLKDKEKLVRLYELGVIDSDWEPIEER